MLWCTLSEILFWRQYILDRTVKKHFLPFASRTTKWKICYYCLDKGLILLYCASDIDNEKCRTYSESGILNGPMFCSVQFTLGKRNACLLVNLCILIQAVPVSKVWLKYLLIFLKTCKLKPGYRLKTHKNKRH